MSDGSTLLSEIDWQVSPDDRWIVMGPNGAGKSTLCAVASGRLGPSSGDVQILGSKVGRCDLRALRARVGYLSGALASRLRPSLKVSDVVRMGADAALEPWWSEQTPEQQARADELLEELGCAGLADHEFGGVSDGERQRILLARVLMATPEVLVLDEPNAALDLAGRTALMATLSQLARRATGPLILVTHHVEDIPMGFTQALLLRNGEVVARGPIRDVIQRENLKRCFDVDVEVEEVSGRWLSWVPSPGGSS